MRTHKHHPADSADFELNTRRAQFSQRHIEDAFQIELMQSQWREFAAVAVLIFVIDFVSFSIDAWRHNGELYYAFLVSSRLAAMVGGALFTWLSWRHHQHRRYVWAMEAYVLLILSIMLTTLFLHGDYGFIAPVTLISVIFALYLLAPFPWRRQIVYAVLCTLFGVAAMHVNGEAAIDFARLSQWLVFAHAVGILVAWQRHVAQRRLYGQRISLEWINAVETQARVHHQALVDLITHELRNPLASIHAQAELVQRTGDASSRSHAQEISAASARIRQMLQVWVEGDRLAGSGGMYMQQQTAEVDESNLAQLTAQVIERAEGLYPRLAIRFDDRFGLKSVRIDARTYALVLLNLLDNAAKYGAQGEHGRVEVVVSVRHARGRVWVRVRDWGEGIAFAQQELVFEKHRRLHIHGSRGDSGTGVGLHLCRTMLSLQGGRLWLRSKPGCGSVFVIDLPAGAT